MLLANAVNDTAVLYTVSKPPKPVPAPVLIVAEEKKKDSASFVKNGVHKNDTALIVKKLPEIPDSNIIAKNIPRKDSGAVSHLPVIAKGKNVGKDTTAVVKKSTPAPVTTLTAKNAAAKKDSASLAKNISRPKKDTTIVTGTAHLPAAKEKPALGKNKNERRDTIIIMNGNKPENNKLLAKNRTVKKEKPALTEQGKDSVQVIKKEMLQAPEEKRDALLNNKDAVVVEKVAAKKDSIAGNAVSKKDTVEILVKTEPFKPAETRPDTIVSTPVKRLRPLINKAAELLTDTSYVAVFVDESKDKFDTIRISIPFNEELLYSKKEKPVVKASDTTAKLIKDSTPVNVISQNIPNAIKNDTITQDKIVKDIAVTQQNIPAQVKTDTIAADKKLKDRAAENIIQQTAAPAIKTDSVAAAMQTKDSLAVIATREPVPAIIKKDSIAAAPDTAKVTKAPPQPLYLNSDCKEVAFDSDIDKLRIKMLLVTSDEDRIVLAKRLLKQKCFLVKQVRALSELFKSDEGKYKWFDAAYAFVSDTGNFSSLSDLIKDDYYLNRFKAMLRH